MFFAPPVLDIPVCIGIVVGEVVYQPTHLVDYIIMYLPGNTALASSLLPEYLDFWVSNIVSPRGFGQGGANVDTYTRSVPDLDGSLYIVEFIT